MSGLVIRHRRMLAARRVCAARGVALRQPANGADRLRVVGEHANRAAANARSEVLPGRRPKRQWRQWKPSRQLQKAKLFPWCSVRNAPQASVASAPSACGQGPGAAVTAPSDRPASRRIGRRSTRSKPLLLLLLLLPPPRLCQSAPRASARRASTNRVNRGANDPPRHRPAKSPALASHHWTAVRIAIAVRPVAVTAMIARSAATVMTAHRWSVWAITCRTF